MLKEFWVLETGTTRRILSLYINKISLNCIPCRTLSLLSPSSFSLAVLKITNGRAKSRSLCVRVSVCVCSSCLSLLFVLLSLRQELLQFVWERTSKLYIQLFATFRNNFDSDNNSPTWTNFVVHTKIIIYHTQLLLTIVSWSQ